MEYAELRSTAKELGINTYGKKKEEIEQLVKNAGQSALPTSKEVEAKEARTERRTRRGGAILGSGQFRYNRSEYLRKGYKRHFFTEDEVDGAYESDWDKVKIKGEYVTKRDGTFRDGRLRNMVLMEKKLEWYEEDRLEKAKPITEQTARMKAGQIGGGFEAAASDLNIYEPNEDKKYNDSIIKQ